MTIRTLVLDDEPLALQRVRWLLETEADITLVGECSDSTEALEVIENERPDLLFLDVQMPEMDGFELLRRLRPEELPVVVFTTAHEHHALKAFEAHALDYLLKPYKPERFKAALGRAREQLTDRRLSDTTRGLMAMLDATSVQAPAFVKRLTIKNEGTLLIVRTEDIDCIESAGNYVAVSVGGESHILRETLGALEERLDPTTFLRISRRFIVNLDSIAEVRQSDQGGHVVVLRHGRKVPVTGGLKNLEKRLRST